jgi:nanoRNase/pAp phosphatase (c-di-AMP/oligoRNAs hydrolase)
VKWSLAFGTYGEQLYFSLRVGDRRMNAGRLIREVIEARGGVAGGHGSMAGARIPLRGLSPAGRTRLRNELVHRFLSEFGARSRRPRRLV